MTEPKMSRDAVRRIAGDWQHRLEAAEAENERLREALQAACVLNRDRAYFKTANGVPMRMPVRAERKVRSALRASEEPA